MTEIPGGVFYRLARWSRLDAVGPDAARFLHSFCTNEVAQLAVGDACEAFFTDAKAHPIAYGWVHRIEDQWLAVLLSSPRAEALRTHLDRYLIREKVELAATGPIDFALVAGEGPLGMPVRAFGAKARVIELTNVGDRREGSLDDFHARRIRARVPLDGIDVDSRNLPQEIDRNEMAISFTKGCYLGQEPVARIDALGRVNWLLRVLSVEGATPSAGDEMLAEGKVVGRVTSAVATNDGSLALAYVRREYAAAGAELLLSGLTARVLPA